MNARPLGPTRDPDSTDPRHVPASPGVGYRRDDARGHGALCCALPERERVGRRVAPRRRRAGPVPPGALGATPRVTPPGRGRGPQGCRFPSSSIPTLARREGIEIVGGRMTLAFGAVSFP